MKSSAALTDTSFITTPLPVEFAQRIRQGQGDDFGRSCQPIVAKGGEPVRDRLRRVITGERIILCSFQAVPLPSDFAEIGPVYISADPPPQAPLLRDELPPGYFNRTFALRAYNAADEISDSTLVEPESAPELIRRWLARAEVAYLHARFAGHGCFACRFERAYI